MAAGSSTRAGQDPAQAPVPEVRPKPPPAPLYSSSPAGPPYKESPRRAARGLQRLTQVRALSPSSPSSHIADTPLLCSLQKHLDEDPPACSPGLVWVEDLETVTRGWRSRRPQGCERWDLGAACSCLGDGTVVSAVCSSRPLCGLRRNVSLYRLCVGGGVINVIAVSVCE